jgi:hypothetical protein
MRTPLAIIISGVFVAGAILVFATGTTHAEPSQYLCVVEQAVGFHAHGALSRSSRVASISSVN